MAKIDEARSAAGDVAEDARSQAQDVSQTVRSEAHEVSEEARREVRHLTQEARDELRSQADAQLGTAAGGLRTASEQLRSMADQAEDPDGAVPDLVRQAASGLGRMAERLDQGGIEAALDDLRRAARRRPGAFLAACAAAGFAVGRLARNVDMGAGSPGGGGAQPSTTIDLRDDVAPAPGFGGAIGTAGATGDPLAGAPDPVTGTGGLASRPRDDLGGMSR